MAKKLKKDDMKVIVSINTKGELNVDANISPLASINVLANALELIASDLLKQGAKQAEPTTDEEIVAE